MWRCTLTWCWSCWGEVSCWSGSDARTGSQRQKRVRSWSSLWKLSATCMTMASSTGTLSLRYLTIFTFSFMYLQNITWPKITVKSSRLWKYGDHLIGLQVFCYRIKETLSTIKWLGALIFSELINISFS